MNERKTRVIRVGEVEVGPGERRLFDLPAARLPTQTMLSLPVTVLNGPRPGPRLWLSSAIHGDELNGVEIIRRVLEVLRPDAIGGTLIAVPIVNVFGFVHQSRYLPDRRDLNRSFPGSKRGSLAARIANLLMEEVVAKCTHGIDLHTASHNRVNLPQVRCNLDDPEARRCAEAFGAPVIIHGAAPRGSLRTAAAHRGIHVLLYEAGEVLRFNPHAIATGVAGVLRVMVALGMIDELPAGVRSPAGGATAAGDPARAGAPARAGDAAQGPDLLGEGGIDGAAITAALVVRKTRWIRAQRSGIVHIRARLGDRVAKRQPLGQIADPLGGNGRVIRASCDGLVIGHTSNPLINRGDAIFHLAVLDSARRTGSPPGRASALEGVEPEAASEAANEDTE